MILARWFLLVPPKEKFVVFGCFIVHVKDQDHIDKFTLHSWMDVFFVYIDNPLCQKGFEDFFCRFLKGERFWFKHMFTHRGQWTWLIGIEPPQWERLMMYCTNEKTIVKASIMSNAWRNMKQSHKYDGGGKISVEATMVRSLWTPWF